MLALYITLIIITFYKPLMPLPLKVLHIPPSTLYDTPFIPIFLPLPRVCILLPTELGKISYNMTPFSTRDMISVRCNLKNRKDVILCSIYMGHKPNRPEIEPTTLLKFAKLVGVILEYLKQSINLKY